MPLVPLCLKGILYSTFPVKILSYLLYVNNLSIYIKGAYYHIIIQVNFIKTNKISYQKEIIFIRHFTIIFNIHSNICTRNKLIASIQNIFINVTFCKVFYPYLSLLYVILITS